MTNESTGPVDEPPRLRLDIHLNLGGLSQLDGSFARLTQYAKPADGASPNERLIEVAGNIYKSRRLRERYLNPVLLGEPVWDMLLALYCFAGEGKALSVSGLCFSAGVPPSTALRWVHILEQRKLISRTKDHSDGRRTLLTMTGEAKRLMDDYLALLQTSGG